MEADWEIEIGPSAPVIDSLWDGFVDLQASPEKIEDLEEVRNYPALKEALLALNSGASLWTSKCDFWATGLCDPYEMDADPEEANCGVACYLDLLQGKGSLFHEVTHAQSWASRLIAALHDASSPCSRVDLVIRRAVAGDREGYGVTAYLSGCGADLSSASDALSNALRAFATAAIISQPHPDAPEQKKRSVTMREPRTCGRVAQLDRAPAF